MAEAFAFGEHADQPALDGFGGAADQFWLGLHFAAALGGGLAEGGAQHRFVEAQLLRDARGPFRAQDAVRNFLDVGQEEIHGAELAFAGGEVHAAGAGDQVVDIGRSFLEDFDVGVGSLFADEFVGVGFAGQGENANFEILLEEERDGALGGGLAGGVGVVVDDDAASEAREELDLRLGEAGAAAGDDVADSGARDGDGVHVAFDEDREIGTAQGFLGAVQVIEHVALGIDRRFRES